MAVRSALTQQVQIGAESTATPGTAVTTNKQLTAMGIEIGPSFVFDTFAPSGYKYDTLVVPNREFVEATITGRPTYTEIIYPLSGLLGGAVISTPSGGTASRAHTFSPAVSTNDIPITFTVAKGGTAATDRSEKFTYGLVTGLTIPFDRSSVTMTGTMIGGALTSGTAQMVGTAAAVALVPVLAGQVCVYSDATFGSLGSTRLTRVMNGELSITNKYAPVWTVDCSITSWAAHVDVKPTAQLRLRVETDTAGMAHLTNARAGTTEFLRIEATGDVIEAGSIKYKMTWDLAGKVMAVSPFTDTDGVYAYDVTYDVVYDSGWTKSLQCVVINSLASL